MPFAENLGTGGGSLDAQYGSSPTANTNAPLLLDPRTSGNFVYTPGTAGNYVGVPHSPSLNILGTEGTPFLSLPGVGGNRTDTPTDPSLDVIGDIDIRARLALDGWASTNQGIVGKYGSSNPTRSYLLEIRSTGHLRLAWLDSSSAAQDELSSTPITTANGVETWIRATLDVDNGAGQYEVKFYTSPDGITWSQLGTTVTGVIGPTSIQATTQPLQIGAYAGTTAPAAGKIYRAQVLDGIGGTTVFDADFTQQSIGSRGFIESTGKLVSLVGNAAQIVDGTTYGFLSGVAGSYWSAPDSAALSITGDIDIRARISLDDWTPAADTVLVGKLASTGDQRSYALRLTTGGTFYWTTSPDGIAGVNTLANAANTLTNGQTYWIRATLDVDDGAGNRVADFYYAADSETEPTVWTSIGTTVTVAGATSIFDGTAALEVGSFNGGASLARGRVYRAIIRGNLTSGTKAFDADFTRQLQFATSFTEGSANLATVTTQGAARIERDRDLDLRVKVALDDWVSGAPQVLLSKRNDSLGNSYQLYVESSGTLRLGLFPVAGVSQFPQSTVPVSFADGALKWVRATVDVNNGSNGWTATFYTSDDGATWTILGAPVVNTGAISTLPTTTPVGIMASDAGAIGAVTSGKIYNAEIRNGIDGPAVLDIDFTSQITSGSQSVIEPASGATIPEAVQFAPNLGTGGAALNARYGSTTGADTNDPLLLEWDGDNYLYAAGGLAGNICTVPHAAYLNLASDFDLRWEAALDTVGISQSLIIRGNTDPNRYFFINLTSSNTMQLTWYPLGTVASGVTSTSTVPFPIVAGQRVWFRVTLLLDNGASGNTTTFYTSDDGVNWSQVGDPIIKVGTTSLGSVTSDMRLWSNDSAAKVYRVQLRDGIGGTIVVDADFTTGITSGDQVTFTESSSNAATVTITRRTSSRKSVAVVRDVWLFGTDDYMEVPDDANGLLDFGASDSFTVVNVYRAWNNFAVDFLTAKNVGLTEPRWNTATLATGEMSFAIVDAAGNTASSNSPVATNGSFNVTAGVVDRVGQTITSYRNGVAGTPDSTAAVGSLANIRPLRVGNRANDLYFDGEFLAGAVFRRALTASELALIDTHYTTGPTAASNALLSESVWWIDAGRTAAAQINRSTTGRKSVACARCIWLLGTDDFFEVPASNLFDFAQGQDYTLLVLHRGWWAQGTNDTLLATSSSTTASAAGWAMSNSSGDPWQAGGRHGDGSIGVTAVAPRRDVGALTGTFLVRDTATDTLTAFTGSSSGTPVTDTTTGTIGNTNVMRLGRLSTTGTEYLDAEVVAAVVWRRALTTAERNAVLAYYGV